MRMNLSPPGFSGRQTRSRSAAVAGAALASQLVESILHKRAHNGTRDYEWAQRRVCVECSGE